jgi:peptidoglycan/xylan/chitin deacetylase (PgdA/CDA1 family)
LATQMHASDVLDSPPPFLEARMLALRLPLAIMLVSLALPCAAAEEAAPARHMAISIDDLPIAQISQHTPAQQETITVRILAALAAHKAPAVGFVNSGKLEVEGAVDPAREALLRRWLAAGCELGNHTRTHPSLHQVEPAVWEADVVAGETPLKALVAEAGGRLRWFRHPYLHIGLSAEVQAATAAFLAGRGYTVAPVTLDNSDWLYARAHTKAWNAGDADTARRLGEDYLRYMLSVVEFYEGQADQIVGRAIPQILLIHANALNADWLAPLLAALAARGYAFISLEEALADPVYARPIDGYTGKGGITWLHRWAITAGLDRGIFRGEPEVPAWVEALGEGG